MPADRRYGQRIACCEVSLAEDRPVRLRIAERTHVAQSRNQLLRFGAAQPPDVKRRCDDRPAPAGDEALRGRIGLEPEEGEAVLGQRLERATSRNRSDRRCLRRAWRSQYEQRQDHPQPAHVDEH
jgi:hypothetical protein